ncbi:AMP-binding protein [Bacillus velezensis]|nr:AMP-binding protein [Bacillus velezensis]
MKSNRAGTSDQALVIDKDRHFTYGELNKRANRLARTLRAKGVQTDQPVAIITRNSIESVVGILAVLKSGGAYVPIDPEYPQDRIRYMLDDSLSRNRFNALGRQETACL